ncbi:hypothetical protein R6L23_09735 [Streptomyces sp. SR27]|uniref:hypothetical protein n=1 Tax=Streptomyces sp. SR27 TaxID=3076630 RepID=UPI00295A99FE|nr:hypothetical protein [Streptomyces sp. SR27]MDV9188492.1 hypothetical protein [Streptomyces sp. SR27]
MSTWSEAELAALVDEATVDAYGEEEQLTGLFTMLEEHLDVPFTTMVPGAEARMRSIDLTPDGRIGALCSHGRVRQAVGILELPLPRAAPEGAERIEAYRRWAGRGRTPRPSRGGGSQERTERG